MISLTLLDPMAAAFCPCDCWGLNFTNQLIQLFLTCQHMLSNQLPFPRQKQYLNNLNELLSSYENHSGVFAKQRRPDMKTEPRPKTMSLERFALHDINNPMLQPIRFQRSTTLHSRAFSTITGRHPSNNNLESPVKAGPQQSRKQKMISLLSTSNFRKQLMNTRKMSAVQSQYRTQDCKSKEKKNKKQCDLRFNMLNKEHELYGKDRRESQGEYQPFQLKLYESNEDKAVDLRLGLSPRQEKKEFLKKNSSINKSILNSIIKLKLNRNESCEDSDKYVKNDQIMKMIKVYKGVDPILSTIVCKQLHDKNEDRAKPIKYNEPHALEGWNHETEQFDVNTGGQSPRQTGSCQI